MKKILTLLVCFNSLVSNAQYYQQCDKLTGSGTSAASYFGYATSLSADGGTALVGCLGDDGYTGSAYVYNRSGCGWTQVSKLIGSGAASTAYQGQAVAISADGKTAIIGGPGDDGGIGAAWIFKRSGSSWSQQGGKLVGTGTTGTSYQGYSVAISEDGSTAVVGGPSDNGGLGAAWVFSRSGSTWSQVGTKLLGSGVTSSTAYPANQGISVAISGNGSTIAVGASGHNAGDGGVWIYTKSGSSWTQQQYFVGQFNSGFPYIGASVALSDNGSTLAMGTPGINTTTVGFANYGGGVSIAHRVGSTWSAQADLVGSNAVGYAQQGASVSLSSNGNKLVFGGGANLFHTNSSNIGDGQIWVFTRSGNVWSQQGSKYVGTGAGGNSQQGSSVAISGDGETIITGGFADADSTGAVWTYATTPAPAGIEQILHNSGVKVYPNPSTGDVTITVTSFTKQNASAMITDMLGRKIMAVDIPTNMEYAVHLDLPDGVYCLTTKLGGTTQSSALQIRNR